MCARDQKAEVHTATENILNVNTLKIMKYCDIARLSCCCFLVYENERDEVNLKV